MNQLSERDLQLHVNILGWLLIASHALFLVIGAFVGLMLLGLAPITGDANAMVILGIVGTFIAGLFTILGIPGMLAGYGLLRRKSWGRVLAIIVAFLGLANFPLGTIISVYAFFVLLQNSASAYFAPQPA